MGNSNAKTEESMMASEAPASAPATANSTEKKKPCPACSACKETRKARDECIFERGEEKCGDLIEAHKQCLRDHGMKI